ncbi:hypothetical protein EYF80_024693 [Liparis tanakae]|uniref:Uncharacterized protein n=1 Tax=Liparis tanakae TaxID=230148 RepID=A0A4Z2HJG9_9TELE|nr:hypothetical protein EYF80_024693 [Liparis tanakae]
MEDSKVRVRVDDVTLFCLMYLDRHNVTGGRKKTPSCDVDGQKLNTSRLLRASSERDTPSLR